MSLSVSSNPCSSCAGTRTAIRGRNRFLGRPFRCRVEIAERTSRVNKQTGMAISPAKAAKKEKAIRFLHPLTDNLLQRRFAPGQQRTEMPVGLRPSLRGTFGVQSKCLLDEISGRRCLGSSWGNGRRTRGDEDPVSASTKSASSTIVNSPGLPRLTGPVMQPGPSIRPNQAVNQVVDIAE